MPDELDVMGPEEGPAQSPEELNEKARQRFAGTAAAIQQIQREERKVKRRDTGVAQTIAQFLTDEQRQHLSILIARLAARDCPSSFILAILSLINEESLKRVREYIEDSGLKSAHETVEESAAALQKEMAVFYASKDNRILVDWIIRLQLVLSVDAENILPALLLDEKNMDGTVLQLTIFVLQEFFRSRKINASYERVRPLTASILQTVFQPYISVKKKVLKQAGPKQNL